MKVFIKVFITAQKSVCNCVKRDIVIDVQILAHARINYLEGVSRSLWEILFRRHKLASISKLVLEVFLLWKHPRKQYKEFELMGSN